MWIDQHPYVFIYLLGCVAVVLLSISNVALFWIIAWITKGNVVRKNLKKLEPEDDEPSLAIKAAGFVALLLFEVALSWIGVLVALWQTASMLLKTLREAITSTPEEIKLLRFPLRNNPNLSREAVWAYVHALRIKVGEAVPDEGTLLQSIYGVREQHPSFDTSTALSQLGGLNVMSEAVISSALSRVASAADEDEDDWTET
jgi:hypothetical protein